MFKNLFLGIVACLLSITATAQSRYLTRGASEGELYMAANWYCNYALSWEEEDTTYKAMLHITENGKKIELNHSAAWRDPDALTGEALPMNIYHVIADATSGALYNTDWYMAYADNGLPYNYDRLWFSDDYGKTWELRDENVGNRFYCTANIEGIVYKGNYGVVSKSINYGKSFTILEGISQIGKEPGLMDCEFYYIMLRGFQYTNDCYETYLVEKTIDSEYVYGQIGGFFPDVFRGGLPGEVYVTSGFPDGSYKVSFSADTGEHFRVVHQRNNFSTFMSDRKAGDFYIVGGGHRATQQPWGWYDKVWIEYYTDYGETLVGMYAHELQRHYLSVNCQGIMSLQASIEDKNNVFLSWEAPETGIVTAYHIYRKDVLIKELQGTSFFDEDLPDGDYTYYVKVVYADGCETLSYNVAKLTIQTTGIVETQGIASLQVYPNPTNGQLSIMNYELRITNIEIFDLMGKTVGAYQFPSFGGAEEVNISHLPTGMYFLRITTEKGTITKKIIKQ